MQAVFTSSYLHSSIIFVGVVLFSVYVYSGSDGAPIASIGDVYDNLVVRSKVGASSALCSVCHTLACIPQFGWKVRAACILFV